MRRWGLDESETVRTHPELSAQQLTELLPGRSIDAIECCRVGIDRFLNGQPNNGFLSAMGLRRMEELYPNLAIRH
jgi:hypothetical protein